MLPLIAAIPGIISAGASIYGAISGANAQEKLAEEERKNRERENRLKQIDHDTDVLRTYPTAGRNVQYYKRGGRIPSKLSKGGKTNGIAKSKWYNSLPATVGKILDPTGISSYGDVYNAWTDGKFDHQDILEPIGALPLIGKVGKLAKYTGKGIKALDDLNDAKKILSSGKTIKKAGYVRRKYSPLTTTTVYPHTPGVITDATKTVNKYKTLDNIQLGLRVAGDMPNITTGINQVKDYGMRWGSRIRSKQLVNTTPKMGKGGIIPRLQGGGTAPTLAELDAKYAKTKPATPVKKQTKGFHISDITLPLGRALDAPFNFIGDATSYMLDGFKDEKHFTKGSTMRGLTVTKEDKEFARQNPTVSLNHHAMNFAIAPFLAGVPATVGKVGKGIVRVPVKAGKSIWGYAGRKVDNFAEPAVVKTINNTMKGAGKVNIAKLAPHEQEQVRKVLADQLYSVKQPTRTLKDRVMWRRPAVVEFDKGTEYLKTEATKQLAPKVRPDRIVKTTLRNGTELETAIPWSNERPIYRAKTKIREAFEPSDWLKDKRTQWDRANFKYTGETTPTSHKRFPQRSPNLASFPRKATPITSTPVTTSAKVNKAQEALLREETRLKYSQPFQQSKRVPIGNSQRTILSTKEGIARYNIRMAPKQKAKTALSDFEQSQLQIRANEQTRIAAKDAARSTPAERFKTISTLRARSYNPPPKTPSEPISKLAAFERVAKLRARSYAPKPKAQFVAQTPEEKAIIKAKLRERSYSPIEAMKTRAINAKEDALTQDILGAYRRSADNHYGSYEEVAAEIKNNPFIRNSLRKRYNLAYGGSATASLPATNIKEITHNADLVVNSQGSTVGTHEQGYDIPVKRGNKTTAYVEPGEVAMDMPDGSKYILSKRTGFAQKYLQLANMDQQLKGMLKSTQGVKRNELLVGVDKIKQQMNRLPAEQERLNAGKPQGMRKAGGGPGESKADDGDPRYSVYYQMFKKQYPNSTDNDAFQAFAKQQEAQIAKIYPGTSNSSETKTAPVKQSVTPSSIPAATSTKQKSIPTYRLGPTSYADQVKKIDRNDSTLISMFGKNGFTSWGDVTDEDIKMLYDVRDRTNTNYHIDIDYDVPGTNPPSTSPSTNSATNPSSTKTSKNNGSGVSTGNGSKLKSTNSVTPETPRQYQSITRLPRVQSTKLKAEMPLTEVPPLPTDIGATFNSKYSFPLYKPKYSKNPPILMQPKRIPVATTPTNMEMRDVPVAKTAMSTKNASTLKSGNASDIIQGVGAVADVAGMIYANEKLKGLKTPPPVIIPKGGYNTRYDDSAERAQLADSTRQAITSAGSSGSGAMRDAQTRSILAGAWGQSNAIAGNKANIETQLRNEAFTKDSRVDEMNAMSRSAYNTAEYARKYQTDVANPQQITGRIAQHMGDYANKLDVRKRDLSSMVTSAMSMDYDAFDAAAKVGYFNELDLELFKRIDPKRAAILTKYRPQ